MFKKITLSLLALAILLVPSFSSSSFANTSPLNEGKLENGRMLIPLRLIAEQLGAYVNWNQQSKVVTITKENTTVRLTINSSNMTVNEAQVQLDVPAKLYNGSRTYVPLRFVGQALGAEIGWNQQTKQATVTSGTKKLVIGIEQGGAVQVPSAQRVTDQRAKVLVEKLNEATNISSIKQVRTYFSPYFTDKFINSIIQAKGLERNDIITSLSPSAIVYSSQTSATLSQATSINEDSWTPKRLYRDATLVATSSGWKIDAVSFTVENDNLRP